MSHLHAEATIDEPRATAHSPSTVRGAQKTFRDLEQDVPVIEVRGGRGHFSLQTIRELWIFREVLSAFAIRAIKVKYKQAAIGVGWAIIQPAATSALFAVTVGKLAKVPSEGAPYLLFALSGMVAWTYFSTAGSASMSSLVEDNALLRKVYFPRDLLPVGAVLAGLVDLLPALAVLAVAATVLGYYPSLVWLALPVPVVLLAVTVSALGLTLSGLNVYYRDVRYALPFVMQIGMFACPIIWSLNSLSQPVRTIVAIGNPVAAAIDAIRRIVLHGQLPNMTYTIGALAVALIYLFLGYSLFKRLERGFADRI